MNASRKAAGCYDTCLSKKSRIFNEFCSLSNTARISSINLTKNFVEIILI